VDEPVDVAAVLLGWVVPDCSQDARNVMPIRTAMREIRCLFITYSLIASRRVCGRLKANEAFGMLTMSSEYRTRYGHQPGPKSVTACSPVYILLLVGHFPNFQHRTPNSGSWSLFARALKLRCSHLDKWLAKDRETPME